MNELYNAYYSQLIAKITEFGGVDSFTTEQAAILFDIIDKMIKELGLNPRNRADFFEGFCRIFNLQFQNPDDFSNGKYVFVPNHISEFDGVLFGTMFQNMLVVAKSDWVSNPYLNSFFENLFSIVGVKRKDNTSGLLVLRKCINHLSKDQDSSITIFVQQTIADIDLTTPEDVLIGAYYIAKKTNAKIIPVYCEQISTDNHTRIVFGNPLVCEDEHDFGNAWLQSELMLRDSLKNPTARHPVLCEKHRKPISERDF